MKAIVIPIILSLIILSGCANKTGIAECDWQPEKEKKYGGCLGYGGNIAYYDNWKEECVLAIPGRTCNINEYTLGPFYFEFNSSNLFTECEESVNATKCKNDFLRDWENKMLTDCKNLCE